jgi:hypothetical protein
MESDGGGMVARAMAPTALMAAEPGGKFRWRTALTSSHARAHASQLFNSAFHENNTKHFKEFSYNNTLPYKHQPT